MLRRTRHVQENLAATEESRVSDENSGGNNAYVSSRQRQNRQAEESTLGQPARRSRTLVTCQRASIALRDSGPTGRVELPESVAMQA